MNTGCEYPPGEFKCNEELGTANFYDLDWGHHIQISRHNEDKSAMYEITINESIIIPSNRDPHRESHKYTRPVSQMRKNKEYLTLNELSQCKDMRDRIVNIYEFVVRVSDQFYVLKFWVNCVGATYNQNFIEPSRV